MLYPMIQKLTGPVKPVSRGFFKHVLAAFALLTFLTGCQVGYIAKSAYYQADILRRRIPIASAVSKFSLTDGEKAQIRLAMEVRQFMAEELGLKVENTYGTYVHLDREYVTYAVSAAPKDKLEHYRWRFPIIGAVPYKGYFNKDDALNEGEVLKKQNLDVYVRGVSAYSTLGWFADPLLSSMLRYPAHRLVDTLIHETVHANLYIKSESSFNERVASYLGLLGTEAFYAKKGNSENLTQTMAAERLDSETFSAFITAEIENLRKWYDAHSSDPELLTLRETEFSKIQEKFKRSVLPKLKTKNYRSFATVKLNNARLLLYDLYMAGFADFEAVAKIKGRTFQSMFQYLKTLESENNPVEKLQQDGA